MKILTNVCPVSAYTREFSIYVSQGFLPETRITLLDAELSLETQQQLGTLLQEFSDIMSKISSDIGLTHLEEMVLHTEPGSIPVVSKPYSFPLKHCKFVKKELANLL